jgi:hypothetical protein
MNKFKASKKLKKNDHKRRQDFVKFELSNKEQYDIEFELPIRRRTESLFEREAKQRRFHFRSNGTWFIKAPFLVEANADEVVRWENRLIETAAPKKAKKISAYQILDGNYVLERVRYL